MIIRQERVEIDRIADGATRNAGTLAYTSLIRR